MSSSDNIAILLCRNCEPGAGSEGGVGWLWAKAATEVASVILVTHANQRSKLDPAIAELGLNITVEYVEDTRVARALGRGNHLGAIAYIIWQARSGAVVRRYERSHKVGVVHHLTWASDSLPSALLASRAPIRVWGPVGGSTRTPFSLYRYLSLRGKVSEVSRDVVNGTMRLVWGTLLDRHATLVVALNHDVVARWKGGPTPVVVASNTALESSELASESAGVPAFAPDRRRTALFVGRLIPWKGLLLALESLRYAPDWHLVVFGDGYERATATARAHRMGVLDRVDFRGQVERCEVMSAFRDADALLFPSFHDSSPWTVGEASALGCPVICLDMGGPPLQAGPNGYVVPAKPGATLARRIGQRLQSLDGRGQPHDSLTAERLPDLLQSWYSGLHGD